MELRRNRLGWIAVLVAVAMGLFGVAAYGTAGDDGGNLAVAAGSTTARTLGLSQPSSPQAQITDAWRMAESSGRYSFRTEIEQVTYPAPSLANVGSTSRTDRLALDGTVDRPDETLELTLYQNGLRRADNGMAVRVDGDTAYGRTDNGQWRTIDNVADAFAPGGDPLAYLSAATNIRFLEERTVALGDLDADLPDTALPDDLQFRGYAFDLDGAAFANYVRAQAEEHLRERGELPSGISLDAPAIYKDATGSGEIWLDEDGLPRRLHAHMELPPARNGERVELDVRTDFHGFDSARIAVAAATPLTAPSVWATQTLFLPENQAQISRTALDLSAFLLLAGLALLLLIHMRRRAAYASVVLSVIGAMLVTPLLQSQQVYAFTENTLTKQAAADKDRERQRAADEFMAEQTGPAWNPHRSPVRTSAPPEPQRIAMANTSPAAANPATIQPAPAQQAVDDLDTTDTDGDGLIDSDEVNWGTDPNDRDSDDDGLLDGAEVHTLGTDPTLDDHDGDGLTDLVEVEGFSYSGRQWYLNPLESDTNGDGLLDGQECANLSSVAGGGGACPDTDGDGTPDVFDFDNDGDQVPDQVDISPDQFVDGGSRFDDDNPFALQINNLTPGEPVLVELQLRPTDAGRLYHSGSVLDWPTYDTKGQIQRTKRTTFANTGNSELRSDAANAANGDMMLTPMLEIFIPYGSDFNYGNLPVRETITDTIDIDGWLDRDALTPLGISVQQDTTTNDLYVYVPLHVVADDTGGQRSAFGAQMLYWPGASSAWPTAHEFRVVWMVQLIINESFYADDSSLIAHVYTDEAWILSGLDVREERGINVAIAGEDPAVDGDLTQNDQFWELATSLSVTFSEGVDCLPANESADSCTADGTRLTVDEIRSRLDWSTNDTQPDRMRWFIDDTISVATSSYEHQGALSLISMVDTPNFLDTYYGSHTEQIPLLLFAYEQSYRSLGLADLGAAGNAASLTVDFGTGDGAKEEITVASLRASAFRHVQGAWEAYALDEYLAHLDVQLAQNPDFQPASGSDYDLAVADGRIIVAQMLYTALNTGLTTMVAIDGEAYDTSAVYTEQALGSWFATTWLNLVVDKMFLAVWGRVTYNSTDFLYNLATLGGRLQQGEGSLALFKSFPTGKVGVATIVVVAAAIIALTVVAVAVSNAQGFRWLDTLFLVSTGLTAVIVAVQLVNLMTKVIQTIVLYTSLISSGWAISTSLFSMLRSVTVASRAGTVVGLIVSIAIVWGMIGYLLATNNYNKFQRNALVAYGVAATVVVVLLFALMFIPVIGPILVLLIALYDALTYLVCELLEANDEPRNEAACKGITGLLTQALAEFFYSAEPVAKLDDMDFTYSGPDLQDPELGYTAQQSVGYSAQITQTIFTGSNGTNRSYAKKTGVEYRLQTEEIDHHKDLKASDWNNTDGDLWQVFTPDSLVVSLEDLGEGINRALPTVYLSMSYRLPIKECTLEGICWVDDFERDTSHMEVSSYLHYDILPATLDKFYTLTAKDGGYTLAWGEVADAELRFPRQDDADNDGLRNIVDGGSDPDDSKWDTDGDGLSDFFELAEGLDPLDGDTDDDTLSDYDEVRRGTDPLRADGDGDGLSDLVELEGWLIGYVDAATTDSTTVIEQTRVWSDPGAADADGDTLDDSVEYVYGLNPNVVEDVDIVNRALTFSDMVVVEPNGPAFLFPFDETAGPTYADASGNEYNASCVGELCPAYAADGRYGSGVDFGGAQQLTVDGIDLAATSFTLFGWSNPVTTGGAVIGQADGPVLANVPGQAFCGHGGAFVVGNTSDNTSWNHLVCTYEADTARWSLYINGSLAAQQTSAATVAAAGQMTIGARGGGDRYSGTLDDVGLYPRAVTATEAALLHAGRYDLNDLFVQPGADLRYGVTAENDLLARQALGYFYAETQDASAPITIDSPITPFEADPLQSVVLRGDAAVDATAADGVYTLNLAAEGVISAPDETVFFESLPVADVEAYFESNRWSDTGGTLSGSVAGNVTLRCPLTTKFGATKSCPTLTTNGMNGQALAVNGSDQALSLTAVNSGSNLYAMNDSFSLSAWVYPTYDETDDTRRTILGWYHPDELWFDFTGQGAGTTAFTDQAGLHSATCTAPACPDSGGHVMEFDGVDDRLTLPNNANINTGDSLSEFSLLLDFRIDKQTNNFGTIVNKPMVIYEQGGGTKGLNIYADKHYADGADVHVCAWNTWSSCVDFFLPFRDWAYRMAVTFDAGNNQMKVYISDPDGTGTAVHKGTAAVNAALPAHANGIGIGGINGGSRINGSTSNDLLPLDGWVNTLAFYPKVLSTAEITFYEQNRDGIVFPLLYTRGTSAGFAFWDGDAGLVDNRRGQTIKRNHWNHVGMTYNHLSDEAVLYANGAPVTTVSNAKLELPSRNNLKLRLGWGGGPYGHMLGQIDSVTLYDDALTADEMSDLATLTYNENMLLYYPLNEAPGSIQFKHGPDAADTGNCSGDACPLAGLRGRINSAALFDGNDAVETNLTVSQSVRHMTVAAWVKADEGTILRYSAAPASNFRLSVDEFAVGNGFSASTSFAGISDEDWFHLVAVYDGDDGLRVYIDGTEVAYQAINEEFNFLILDFAPEMVLGEGLVGQLDDVRLYETAFTAGQAAKLYAESQPAVQFRFDEDSETSAAYDSSINGLQADYSQVTSSRAYPGIQGRLGNAVRFSVTDPDVNFSRGYVTPPIDATDEMTSSFTIMSWVRTDAYRNRSETLFEWRWGAVNMRAYDDTREFQVAGAGRGTGQLPYTKGQWDHFTFTVDGGGNARYYLNGELVQTTTFNSSGRTFYTERFVFGQELNNGGSNLMDTSLDEFVIYHRGLSADEVRSIYNQEMRLYRSVGAYRITVDTGAPQVELRSMDDYRANQSTVLDVGTSDDSSRVMRVDVGVKAPGAADFTWQGAPACTDTEPGVAWCPTFDPSRLSGEGAYQLTFRATDAAGNQQTSSTYTLQVDGTPPVVASAYNDDWIYPTRDGDDWRVALSGTISDPALTNSGAAGSGIVTDSVLVNLLEEDGDVAGTGAAPASVSGGTWSVDYPIPGVRPNGRYSVQVIAQDQVGNVITDTVGTVNIDQVAPNVAIKRQSGAGDEAPLDAGTLLSEGDSLGGEVFDLARINGAVLQLNFEEMDNGCIFYDSSGKGHHATCPGQAQTVPGLFGMALFPMAGEALTVPANDDLNLGPDFTLGLWLAPDVLSVDSTPLVTVGNDKAGLRMENGRIVFFVTLDGDRYDLAADVLQAGDFQHIAGTYNGHTMRLYHDGVEVAALAATGTLDESSETRIGGGHGAVPLRLDLLTVFERALSERELVNLAQTPAAGVQALDLGYEQLLDAHLTDGVALPVDAQLFLPFHQVQDANSNILASTWADYAGGQAVVTCHNDLCPDAGEEGIRDSSVRFNGQNHALLAGNVAPAGTTALTAALWLKVDDVASGTRTLLAQRDGRRWLGLTADGRLFTEVGGVLVAAPAPVGTGWHHAAVTLAVVDGGALITLYMDGAPVAGASGSAFFSDAEVWIGAGANATEHFEGLLDEVAVFTEPLPQGAIQALLFGPDPQLSLTFEHASMVNGDLLDTGTTFDVTAQLVAVDPAEKSVAGDGALSGSNSLQVDGVDDGVVMEPTAFLVPGQDGFSLMAWAYVDSVDNGVFPIIGSQNGGAAAYPFLQIVDQSKVRAGFGDGSDLLSFTSDPVLTANQTWNHLAATFDGTTMRIYVNGAEVAATGEFAGKIPAASDAPTVGMGHGRFFNGMLDNVRIYPRPVSAADVLFAYGSEPWRPAAVGSAGAEQSEWTAALPQIEGLYRVNGRTADLFDNVSLPYPLWEGMIDTVAPRLGFSVAPQSVNGIWQPQITADADDINYDATALPATCLLPTAQARAGDDVWTRILRGETDAASSTPSGMATTCFVDRTAEGVQTFTTCDSAGNCADVSITVLPVAAPDALQAAAIDTIAATPPTELAVNQLLSLQTTYPALDGDDTGIWYWGDGGSSPAEKTGTTLFGSHVYTATGSYTAYLVITDGATGDPVAYTVPWDLTVYDPAAGDVSGGGQFQSPAGSDPADPSAAGAATVSLLPIVYDQSAAPDGGFTFSFGGTSFTADAFDWLLIESETTAVFKATGMVNGQLGPNGLPYHALVWVEDGTPDTIRVRIWWEDEGDPYLWWLDQGGNVIYDNGGVTGQSSTVDSGDLIINANDNTVPVTIGYVRAERQGDRVLFIWQTVTETANAGFNILVETGGGPVQLNEHLIPSQVIDSVEPVNYSIALVTDARIFYLEEVALDGTTGLLGPFTVDESAGVRVDPGDLDEVVYLPYVTK